MRRFINYRIICCVHKDMRGDLHPIEQNVLCRIAWNRLSIKRKTRFPYNAAYNRQKAIVLAITSVLFYLADRRRTISLRDPYISPLDRSREYSIYRIAFSANIHRIYIGRYSFDKSHCKKRRNKRVNNKLIKRIAAILYYIWFLTFFLYKFIINK